MLRLDFGAPGEIIAERPVNSFNQPAGRPINTPHIRMLRRPLESTQFRSRRFRKALRRHGLVGSMGRVGAAGDNAAMESFFSTLQTNVLDTRRWTTRAELRLAIIHWIEATYNRRRRQRRLGKLTPIEFETIMKPAVALAA